MGAQIQLVLAFLLTAPGIYVRLTGAHVEPAWEAGIFGLAVLGAAFLLSWAAEVAQKDISQALAVAILALIAVLPEYAVDMVFAWKAAKNPEFGHYALANMTGANRLLVGIGWTAVVFLYAVRFRKVGVKLEKSHRTEVLFLGLATLFSITIPARQYLGMGSSLHPIDSFFLVGIFVMYTVRVARAEHHEPELIGPAALMGRLSPRARRLCAIGLFVFSGGVIFLSAEPFAESLVAAGKGWGINEFLLVQWVAPLASEAPEFIVALLWTFRGDAEAGLGALVSSKVNQWTLLVGTIPLVYSLSLGQLAGLPLDLRQEHELWLTAAQSLFAVAILANLSLSWYGALALFVLFMVQAVYEPIRIPISITYLVLSAALIVRDRRHYPALFRAGMRR